MLMLNQNIQEKYKAVLVICNFSPLITSHTKM